ncbi:PREDICTED: uncharacterized protein LOC105460822, partial [Wasmannia auropunctata]|uniref:uncharacterized protein LOC105460822 n=1 Tax=Wasmannia auropunctata TaxID=64793 RepID=UPI0005EFA201
PPSPINKNQKLCNSCLDSAGSKTYNPKVQYSRLVSLKCYRQKTLFFVNDNTFQYFLGINCDICNFFIEKLKNIKCDSIKYCHDLANKIKLRFIKYKIKTNCRRGRLDKPVYDSKTMAMHASVK